MNVTRCARALVVFSSGCVVGEWLDSSCSSPGGSRCEGVIVIDAADEQVPVFSIEGLAGGAPSAFTLADPEDDPCTYYIGRPVWEVTGLSEEDLPLSYGDPVEATEALTPDRWYLATFAAGDRIGSSTFNVEGWQAVFRPGESDSIMRWSDLAAICEEPPPRTTW